MLFKTFEEYLFPTLNTLVDSVEQCSESIELAVDLLTVTFNSGKKVMLFGNGGSAADSQHIAAEFVNGMGGGNHIPMPAIALTTDTSVITSIANDSQFELIFKKQIEALASPGDLLFAISTSGKSTNIMTAINYGISEGLSIILLTGCGSGVNSFSELQPNIEIGIPSKDTQTIQECMLVIEHYICAKVINRVQNRK